MRQTPPLLVWLPKQTQLSQLPHTTLSQTWWDEKEAHWGTSTTPIRGTTEELTPMVYHLITHHQLYVTTRVMSLPSSLKGSLLDSRTRSTRIIESMLRETSIPTPRSPPRGRHPTHYLSPTSRENLETTQHSQYFCPQEGHPWQQKERGNSISSKRD